MKRCWSTSSREDAVGDMGVSWEVAEEGAMDLRRLMLDGWASTGFCLLVDRIVGLSGSGRADGAVGVAKSS